MTVIKPKFFFGRNGELFDTSRPSWSSHPLRQNYSCTHRDITSVADLKATLRAGEFAWPGGYQMYFITSDGAALSFASAKECFRMVAYSIKNKLSDGYRIVACEINYEDQELYCDHSGERIPAAYGDD